MDWVLGLCLAGCVCFSIGIPARPSKVGWGSLLLSWDHCPCRFEVSSIVMVDIVIHYRSHRHRHCYHHGPSTFPEFGL